MSNATAKSSGLLAAGTTTVVDRKSMISGVTVISDGTNLATVVVYDNATAGSGTVIAKGLAGSGNPTVHIGCTSRVRADNGITVVVSGTGSGAVIYYEA